MGHISKTSTYPLHPATLKQVATSLTTMGALQTYHCLLFLNVAPGAL